MATPVLTLIGRGPLRSLLLGHSDLGSSGASCWAALTSSHAGYLLLALVVQSLKKDVLSVLGGQSAL